MTLHQTTKKVIGVMGILILVAFSAAGCVGETLLAKQMDPSKPVESIRVDPPAQSSEAAMASEPAVSQNPTSVSKTVPESCPVTKPPDPAFVPPAPYSPQPPGKDEFWYGTEALWTALPADGQWQQLLYGEKVFWWREGYVWNEEPQPALTVTGRRLDGPAPSAEASRATNAFAADIGSAMLVGMKLPMPGCWEITGQYGGEALSFIVWVAP